MRRILLILAAVLGVGLGAAACGSGQAPQTRCSVSTITSPCSPLRATHIVNPLVIRPSGSMTLRPSTIEPDPVVEEPHIVIDR